MHQMFVMRKLLSSLFVLILVSNLFFISGNTSYASNNTVTIHYKKDGFSIVNIHYKIGNGNWTTAPGIRMSSSEFNGYSKISINMGTATSLTSAFNNGTTWDNNNGKNYTFGVNVYTVTNGSLIVGTPIQPTNPPIPTPTIVPTSIPTTVPTATPVTSSLTVYYKKDGFSIANIHYQIGSGAWTVAPGLRLNAAEVNGFWKTTLALPSGATLTAAFNNGSTWDNNNGKNYSFKSGTFTVNNGSITTGAPLQPTAVPTAVPTTIPTTVPTVVPTAVPTIAPTNPPISLDKTTIYYRNDAFQNVNIHFKVGNGAWTTAPGIGMSKSAAPGYWTVTINLGYATTMTACFNNGSTWDSKNGSNYVLSNGIFTIENGQIVIGAPAGATPKPTSSVPPTTPTPIIPTPIITPKPTATPISPSPSPSPTATAPSTMIPKPISTPSQPTATAITETSVDLVWSAPNGGVGSLRYKLYVESFGAKRMVSDGSSTYAKVYGLTANNPYRFEVQAYDLYGNQSNLSPATQVFTKTADAIYLASTHFNAEQGFKNWYYQSYDPVKNQFNPLSVYQSSNASWKTSYDSWTAVGSNWMHPGTVEDAVRKFVAPRAGKIQISGTVSKLDNGGGDGVQVQIRKNDTSIWPSENQNGTWHSIAYNDTVGVNAIVSVNVMPGDELYFIVNKKSNDSYDKTAWNPSITYDNSAWTFKVMIGIESTTAQKVGGFEAAKSIIRGQLNQINTKFNNIPQLNAKVQYLALDSDFYQFSGDSELEVRTKKHPNHDILLVYNTALINGGWIGDNHAIHVTYADAFSSDKADAVLHELIHSIGAMDIYALQVNADPESAHPIMKLNYVPTPGLMTYPYGETRLDRHSGHMLNITNGKMFEDADFVSNRFPNNFQVGISVTDEKQNPVPNALVTLYPVEWFSNKVTPTAMRSDSTGQNGEITYATNPFGLYVRGIPWHVQYPLFLVETKVNGHTLYNWLNLPDAQSFAYENPGRAYRLSIIAPDRVNALENGDFEAGTSNWNFFNSAGIAMNNPAPDSKGTKHIYLGDRAIDRVTQTVTIQKAGNYVFKAKTAASASGGTLKLIVDGSKEYSALIWGGGSYQVTSLQPVWLNVGDRVEVQLNSATLTSNWINIDDVELTLLK